MDADKKDDDWPASSSSITTTPLWSDAPSLKSYSDIMDFGNLDSAMGLGGPGGMDMGMGIDMDFNPMTLEPTGGMGLYHFDPLSLGFAPGQGFANFGYDDQFCSADGLGFAGFHLQAQGQGPAGSSSSGMSSVSVSSESEASTKERRLSITSTSSSSAGSLASLSPVPESLSSPSPALGYASASASASPAVHPKEESVQSPGMEGMEMDAENPFAELANTVRQTTGVTLAVPMAGLAAAFPFGTTQLTKNPQSTSSSMAARNASNETATGHASATSSAASTPPPSTPTSSVGSPFGLVVNTSAGAGIASASASQVPTPTMATTAASSSTGPQPRPKTSHTTIERRYRTNLNARIQSLRMAVPALRVLEDGVKDGAGSKKIKKNVRGGVVVKSSSGAGIGVGIGVGVDAEEVDIIDERGFVDGVKVARKCSKANVLGKAVEYIKVLKRRERRLKAEQAGLKTLMSGLVGGPALVREWERQWRERFGGEERDEVEGELGGELADDGDDEDSEEDEDEEETGKKRKRAKVAPKKPTEKKERKPAVSAQPPVVLLQGEAGAAVGPGGVPVLEKRKRGRPRKVVPPPVTLAPIPPVDTPKAEDVPTPFTAGPQAQWAAAAQAQAQGPQPQQYLLAVFALFSFFNSPLTSSSPTAGGARHHTGAVLGAVHPPLAYAPEIVSQLVSPSPIALGAQAAGWSWKEYVQLFHLLVSLCVLASFVASWVGVTFGWSKMEGVVKRGRSLSVASFRGSSEKERRKTGLKGWVGLAMDSVLEGDAASLTYFERSQIYGAISTKRHAPASELVTLALVRWSDTGIFGRVSRMRANAIWSAAKAQVKFSGSTKSAPTQKDGKTYQTLVFESVPGVEEAVHRLAGATKADREGEGQVYDPLEVLGVLVVKERVKRHLGRMFVSAVGAYSGDAEREEEEDEDAQRHRTIDAARELGGGVEALAKVFERVWKTSCASFDDTSAEDAADLRSEIDSEDGEIRALMTALILFRRVFAQSDAAATSDVECSSAASSVTMTPTARERESAATLLMSPPPSPGPSRPARAKADERQMTRMLGLRRALGHRVFEELGLGDGVDGQQDDSELGLEDARDKVVDLIVEVERRERVFT